ncbi:MAG: c-type cytochrome [Burkholderiaceae bacterium]|jgi:cytochrome c553
MRLVASFLLFFGLSVAYAQPAFDLKKGAASFGGVCVACHAADGNSAIPANPKLAGQHPEYLAKQLREYKSGKRANAIMAGFAATLSEQQMLDIAHWLATQTPKPGFATDAELAAQGERIYRGGIADRQIASCAGCHGPAGAGIPAQFPRLAGQHAEYTKTQLSAFRSGARANNSVMNMVAAKLNDKEIEALAQYLAGLR